jgi:alpha-D-ribose 1-methylphosphonate 5-triphosphate synthase subunit PhnI
MLGTWTQSQDTDVPSGQGFATSFKWIVRLLDASLDANSRLIYVRTKS